MAAELTYEDEGQQLTFALEQAEITIGRDLTNDLVIRRPSVSRRHARLYRDGPAWRVADMGSLNGTRINDLAHADAELRDGDRIWLHDFPLEFRDDSAPRVSLTGDALGLGTVVQSAVDFSALASHAAEVPRLQRLLRIVTRASETILATASLDEIFQRVLDLVFEQLPVERGFIMLRDDRGELVTRCVRHRAGSAGGAGQIRFSRTIAEKVCRDKVAVLTSDAQNDPRFAAGASVFDLGIRSAMAAPLWSGERVEGLIHVDTLRPKAYDRFDLDLLSALGNHVAIAIEQARLQQSVLEQQLVRRRLERYHSPAVVELIASHTGAAGEAWIADERDVTVLFADVVDFTRHCERVEPREIAALLNRYFSEMAEAIFRHQGTLDKFIGDCVMAVFGAPFAAADHARQALDAALEMREALAVLNAALPEDARLCFRVGIHSGRVIAGDIGSVRRTDYTVLGATVNLASRLESVVARPGQIVISAVTLSQVGTGYATEPLGEHQLKGIRHPVACHALIGRG